MRIPLDIKFHHVDHSEAVVARIREYAERLERLHPGIIRCQVSISQPHQHKHKGELYDVRIRLEVPGQELIVNREGSQNHAHEDVYVAIRDAFNALTRQLEVAEKRMAEIQERRLPVIENDSLVGIVSLNDVAIAGAEKKRPHLDEVGATLAQICQHRTRGLRAIHRVA